jgi:hypothetical protein
LGPRYRTVSSMTPSVPFPCSETGIGLKVGEAAPTKRKTNPRETIREKTSLDDERTTTKGPFGAGGWGLRQIACCPTLVAHMRAAKRAGRTEKLSISMNRADVALLRKRAEALYGGNLSAALGEGVARLREELGREALVSWLGASARTTAEERDEIRAGWALADRRRH